MPSWRDLASQSAQDDLDELLNLALGFAQEQLDKHGAFFPYAAAVSADGATRMIAVDLGTERPASNDVIAACVEALKAGKHELRAAVVVADVRLPELDSDAVCVDLEHAEGTALRVLLPYAKRRLRKDVVYGDLRAESGQRIIWA